MSTFLVVSSAIVSVFTLMSIGGNDVANSQGTAVGSGAISIRGAQILAGICEFAGAALVGSAVTNTIGNKIVSEGVITDEQYCWGMFSALLSVGIWMVIASFIKMPVSATHSIVGSLFGLNLVITHFDWSSPDWGVLGKIAVAWVVTPLLSFFASYIFLSVLNKYWPSDVITDEDINDSASLLPYAESPNRSSLINYAMAPPSVQLTPIATPKPINAQKVRLTWASAVNKAETETDAKDIETDENRHEIAVDEKVNDRHDGTDDRHDSSDEFKPQKFQFALLFGILMATLVIFLLIGGPKIINIDDGDIEVDDWVIVVIAFGSLFVFMVIGYFIEDCYRRTYIRLFYSNKEKREYRAVQLTETETKTKKKKITCTPPGTPGSPESKKDEKTEETETETQFNNNDYFRLYLVIASGAVDFAQGGNDVANVLGPFGQIFKYATTGSIEGTQPIPIYVAGGAGLCVAIGFALFGGPVLETIGKRIAKLSYRSGLAAQFCAAATVLACNVMGLPVSSSTVIVGGVSGVAFYNKRNKKKPKNEEEIEYKGCLNKWKYFWSHDNVRVLFRILAIWIITIPVNAIITGAIFAFINVFL